MAVYTRTIMIVRVAPTMPWEQFRVLHKIAHYTELLDRDEQGRVVWDDAAEFPYLDSVAEADFARLQRGEEVYWELPEPVASADDD